MYFGAMPSELLRDGDIVRNTETGQRAVIVGKSCYDHTTERWGRTVRRLVGHQKPVFWPRHLLERDRQ